MAIDPLWIWVGLGALALLVVVGLIARGARRTQTAELRDKFGPEYKHALAEAGSRKRGERELISRAQAVREYEIRALSTEERQRYRGDWLRIEQRFVERPVAAVAEADELVADIMRIQGYPLGDFEKHAADLSVNHPRVVDHYRAGHRVISSTPQSTEDLRRAMLHYRALFEELLGTKSDVARDVPLENEVEVPRPASRGEGGPERSEGPGEGQRV